MSAPFTARYRGHCPACPAPIVPGEAVVYVDDELRHQTCEDATPRRPERQPCPICWLTACDCRPAA